ncbi:MAG: ABC transporter permease [Deltaproteobacteria bacterium]|nr:ABC transporter permease [Deltaproteobacteria bacterium]
MIQITNLSKTYVMGDTPVKALDGVTLTIEKGEFVAIMGPSGSGKSTLMHILGLLDVPDEGSYKLLGEEVSHLSEDELALLRSRTIGFIFQQFNLLARRSALQNVALPLIYSNFQASDDHAQELLGQVGLGNRLDHKPSELSGGQQQRVAIARSLINDPPLVFADEPTGNLDSASEEEIIQILTRLNEAGITVVIVTHEPEIGARTKRIIRMRDGKIQSDERVEHHPLPGPLPSRERGKESRKFSSGSFFKEMAEHFRQAFGSIVSNKIRSILSMLGILIGVAAVIAMLALGAGAKSSVETQLASLGSNLLVLRPGAARTQGVSLGAAAVSRLTLEDARDVKQNVESVSRVSPSVTGRGQVVYLDKNWSTQIQGVGPDYASMRASEPSSGRFFDEEENQKRARVAVIGKTIVRELFGTNNPLGEYFKINKVLFQVIGVLPEKGANGFRDQDDVIVIPLNTAMRRLLGKDYVDSIDIEVKDASLLDTAQNEIQELVQRRYRLDPNQQQKSFEVRNMADIQAALSETSKTLSWLLASIATISLVVGGIGIMNIMLVSVTERTREIGLRKALGAKRRDILMQFLIEAMVVSVTGGLIGVSLGWTVTYLMSKLSGWAAIVSSGSIILAFVFSAGIGIVFGLWPAKKASQLNPIQALRHE